MSKYQLVPDTKGYDVLQIERNSIHNRRRSRQILQLARGIPRFCNRDCLNYAPLLPHTTPSTLI